MDPLVLPTVTALVGLIVQGIALTELLLRLRLRKRHQYPHPAELPKDHPDDPAGTS